MTPAAHYQTLEYDRVLRIFGGFAKEKQASFRVLDFGCGPGKYLRGLTSVGCEVTAADVNESYVAGAREAGHAAYSPSQLFDAADLRFDAVLLSHVVEHLDPPELMELVARLCGLLSARGRLVIVTPTPGERFYHDFSHVRPYLPQSIRHAFGQDGAPLSFGSRKLIELVDIHFFKDPYRTRLLRSFYVGRPAMRTFTRTLNSTFDFLWRASGGRIGTVASWLGVYELRK